MPRNPRSSEDRLRRVEAGSPKDCLIEVIAAYLDESFDMGQSGVYAVGGILGRGVAIFELERRWLKRRAEIGIQYFKASECFFGKGEFAKFVANPKKITKTERDRLNAISTDFLEAIVNMPFERTSYLIATGVGIVQDDFYEVIQDPKARAVLGDNPYWLAYDFAMVQCAWAMKQLGTGDHVAFVCDEHQQHSLIAYEEYRKLKGQNPNAAAYMGTFSSMDEKACQPLQAADAVVYEVRRVLQLALGKRRGKPSPQFGMLTTNNSMHIIQNANKDNLLNIVATHRPGEPFRLDEIMDQNFAENISLRIDDSA